MKTISVNEIKVADLQKNIVALISREYIGYAIKNAYKVSQDNVITYDVNLTNGIQSVILSFDKNYSFIAVIEPQMTSTLKLIPETKTHLILNNFKLKINKKSSSNYYFR